MQQQHLEATEANDGDQGTAADLQAPLSASVALRVTSSGDGEITRGQQETSRGRNRPPEVAL